MNSQNKAEAVLLALVDPCPKNDAERAEAVILALGDAVICDRCYLAYRNSGDISGFMCLCGWMLFIDPRRPAPNTYRPDLLWMQATKPGPEA